MTVQRPAAAGTRCACGADQGLIGPEQDATAALCSAGAATATINYYRALLPLFTWAPIPRWLPSLYSSCVRDEGFHGCPFRGSIL